uniref:Uncharacterized protein n=1 Tax=Zooxanthella nutricula TaxID=1333877 RepID=A0A6U9FQ92_9DINO|mmetsp:Transcript_81/g.249  ORF Transcript_81/g.249 Transcript_81/m.249 type:complete len:165 (+) Transcript_81:117-611(+)
MALATIFREMKASTRTPLLVVVWALWMHAGVGEASEAEVCQREGGEACQRGGGQPQVDQGRLAHVQAHLADSDVNDPDDEVAYAIGPARDHCCLCLKGHDGKTFHKGNVYHSKKGECKHCKDGAFDSVPFNYGPENTKKDFGMTVHGQCHKYFTDTPAYKKSVK